MLLVLEDGFSLSGERGGKATDAGGEIVFNTCMSGYQEVLSDPSYAGQMVVMTYPLIGNYGVSPAFLESGRPWILVPSTLTSFAANPVSATAKGLVGASAASRAK